MIHGCLLHPPPTPCLLRICISRRPWSPMFLSAILQSFWESLPTNDWRGVTHPLENILFNSNNCESLLQFSYGSDRHLPALDHDQTLSTHIYLGREQWLLRFSYVVSEDTTARSPRDLSLDPRARQPQFPHCSAVAFHTVFSWHLAFSVLPCNRFPSPLEIMP